MILINKKGLELEKFELNKKYRMDLAVTLEEGDIVYGKILKSLEFEYIDGFDTPYFDITTKKGHVLTELHFNKLLKFFKLSKKEIDSLFCINENDK